MLFSLITPTCNRFPFLIMRYTQLLAQKEKNWEWILLDSNSSSEKYFSELGDSRVRYYFSHDSMSLGEKRNELRRLAKGEWIVHCDDDDYFSPNYLKELPIQNNTDLLKTLSWFAHDKENQRYFYIDSGEKFYHHYRYNPLDPIHIQEIKYDVATCDHLEKQLRLKHQRGYGFSFVYHKKRTSKVLFEDIDVGEDQQFYTAIEATGGSVQGYHERFGNVVKRLHSENLSNFYAQFRLPQFLLPSLIPFYWNYLHGDLS